MISSSLRKIYDQQSTNWCPEAKAFSRYGSFGRPSEEPICVAVYVDHFLLLYLPRPMASSDMTTRARIQSEKPSASAVFALTLLFCFLVSSPSLSCQPDTRSQRLTKWTDHNLADTLRLQVADRLVRESYWSSQPDSAHFYAEAQLALARNVKHPYWVARALHNLGSLQLRSADYASAVLNLEQSLRLYDRSQTWYRAGQVSQALGNTLRKQGMVTEALQALLASLDYAEKAGPKGRAARAATLNSLGSLYLNQQDYETAAKYYKESLGLHSLLGKQRGIAANLNNLSKVHTQWGKYAIAIDYLARSMALKRKNSDLEGIANSLKNYGDIHLKSRQLDSASIYYSQARVLQDSLGLLGDEASSYGDLGIVALARQDWMTARDYCAIGWQQAERLGDLKVQVKNGDCLYQAQLQLAEHQAALATLERTYALRDSFLSAENTRELERIQQRYAEDRAQLEDAMSNGLSLLWWLFGVGLLTGVWLLLRRKPQPPVPQTLPPATGQTAPGPLPITIEPLTNSSPPPPEPNPWINQATELVTAALRDRREVTTSSLAREMTTSERQLLRRCKEMTGKTTTQFLLEIRLDYARELLDGKRAKSVAELAAAAGLKSTTYFSQRFNDRFGFRPAEKLAEQ